jgi:hypothetical protein
LYQCSRGLRFKRAERAVKFRQVYGDDVGVGVGVGDGNSDSVDGSNYHSKRNSDSASAR